MIVVVVDTYPYDQLKVPVVDHGAEMSDSGRERREMKDGRKGERWEGDVEWWRVQQKRGPKLADERGSRCEGELCWRGDEKEGVFTYRFLRRCSAAACASASSLVLVRFGGGSGGTSIRGEEGRGEGGGERGEGVGCVCVVVVTNGGNAFSYLILSLGSSRNSGHKTQDLIAHHQQRVQVPSLVIPGAGFIIIPSEKISPFFDILPFAGEP